VIQASPFEIHSELDDGDARLVVAGELDLATAPRVAEAVDGALGRGARRVVIDLTRLTFLDSSGLRMFIVLSDRAAAEDWTLGLLRPAEPSRSVFRITGAGENPPFLEDPTPPR
jgi:anti-sigma B factor antagonist